MSGDILGCGAPIPVAVKVYEKPSLTPKKQKMATREAIVLKYLNAQGCVFVHCVRQLRSPPGVRLLRCCQCAQCSQQQQ
jgi:hypothetical protein